VDDDVGDDFDGFPPGRPMRLAPERRDGPDLDRNGAIRGERSIPVTALRPGDCVSDLQYATGRYADVLPTTGSRKR
jgi:hypothetical protein